MIYQDPHYVELAPWAGFVRAFKNDNEELPLLARWHIVYQIHVKYVHTTYTSLHDAVLVE